MPVSTIVALVGVVAVFAMFASALAWTQLQTRRPRIADEVTRRPRRRPF